MSDNGEYSDTPRKTYVKCVSIEEPSEEGGWSMMTIEESSDSSSSSYGRTGIWIKGLSSFNGILYNVSFNMNGFGSILLEVSVNGETLYLNKSAGNAEIRDSSSPDIRVDRPDVRDTHAYKGAGQRSLYPPYRRRFQEDIHSLKRGLIRYKQMTIVTGQATASGHLTRNA